MTFQKSLSCRIAEGFLSKEEASMSFPEFAQLAREAGYDAVCMRASQIGIHSPQSDVTEARRVLDSLGLGVSMVTGDFDIVYNNDRGPDCLRNIVPYLDLAEMLGSSLIRICVKHRGDIARVHKAADQAATRGIKLVHQCHVQSLFETLDEIVVLAREIDHPNFGIIFEAANLEQCGQDYGPAAVAKLSPWLANVYLQNQRMKPGGAITLETWCRGPVEIDLCEIPDEGGIDFTQVIAGLRESGYSGYVTVHQSAPEDENLTALESARQTANFIDSLCS